MIVLLWGKALISLAPLGVADSMIKYYRYNPESINKYYNTKCMCLYVLEYYK